MNLVDRAKNILLQPKQEWAVIEAETTDTKTLYTSYAMILAAIPAVAGFIGMSIIGYGSLLGVVLPGADCAGPGRHGRELRTGAWWCLCVGADH